MKEELWNLILLAPTEALCAKMAQYWFLGNLDFQHSSQSGNLTRFQSFQYFCQRLPTMSAHLKCNFADSVQIDLVCTLYQILIILPANEMYVCDLNVTWDIYICDLQLKVKQGWRHQWTFYIKKEIAMNKWLDNINEKLSAYCPSILKIFTP